MGRLKVVRGESGERSRIRVRLAALGTSLLMIMSLTVVMASPALAHHPILDVSYKCNDAGMKEVTWTVSNGNWSGRTMTLDQVGYTDGTAGFVNIAVGTSLAASGSTSDTLVYPLSETGTKTLSVRADWNNGGSQNVSASLSVDLAKLKCHEVTTTTAEVTTTTSGDTTTTSGDTTTTEATTTTTEATTTITDEVSPTEVTTTTEATTTTAGETTPTDVTSSTNDDSVLGTSITNTSPPQVEATDELPFTGGESTGLLLLAFGLLGMGATVVITFRSRED